MIKNKSLEIKNLASGSKGNCSVIRSGSSSLILDAGINFKNFLAMSRAAGVENDKYSAIVISHEHTDHTFGAAVLSKELGIPVIAHQSVQRAMRRKLGTDIDFVQVDYYENGFFAEDIWVKPFRVPHDAAFCAGYRFCTDDKTVATVTDLGMVTKAAFEHLKGAETVLLESNYDPEMLKCGRYPNHLKQRIAGHSGHLSNGDAAEAAAELVKSGTKNIILAHLSEENNTPETAFNTVTEQLKNHGITEGHDVEVFVAGRFLTEEFTDYGLYK